MENQSIKIDIYGIPEEVYRCYGCIKAKSMCDDAELSYTHYPVFREVKGEWIPDTVLISLLAKQIGQGHNRISYPVILVDGKRIPLRDFRSFLVSKGYDPD